MSLQVANYRSFLFSFLMAGQLSGKHHCMQLFSRLHTRSFCLLFLCFKKWFDVEVVLSKLSLDFTRTFCELVSKHSHVLSIDVGYDEPVSKPGFVCWTIPYHIGNIVSSLCFSLLGCTKIRLLQNPLVCQVDNVNLCLHGEPVHFTLFSLQVSAQRKG